MNLNTRIGKLKLKNPIILASGTFDRGITTKIDINKLGGLVTKTITLKPREGNPLPHIFKTRYGWLNSVGLKNMGLKKYLTEELPFWKKYNTQIFTSIGGENTREYIKIAKSLESLVSSLEVNVSCPNVDGLFFGADPRKLKNLISAIRKNFKGFIAVKLSPNVSDIILPAKVAMAGGADALIIANTYLGLELIKSKPVFQQVFAGYSGGAVKPLTMRLVWQTSHVLKCPVIASGGVENTQDVIDYLTAGAKAVQIGSANFLNPKVSVKIVDELRRR
ncbi:MAG: dihydroorotate dehydrogenase [Patescibacteria group bacterium]|jgi:dihydroorotate dehydrogenase (NAD+) catalytic subunit